ncbi:MAG: RNA polymerase sigma factor [Gemmataceae bacterium]|nr:RNA polymerase sigma factor [Gemmataceae bacterium]
MATNRLSSVLQRLLHRVAPATPGEAHDADLLDRFVRSRDEAAFELLIWRHGPMVLGLCQRLLDSEQDVEDAFQATFLVLVRKARSIGKREALASWLYKVAHRIACRARPRGPALSHHVDELPAADTSADVIWRDVRAHLDQELARLPEAYRRPMILCYLEGKTNDEAARALGWPKGTVATRLTRGRERLRRRLRRRGWTLSAAALASVLAEKALAGPLPAGWVHAALGGVRAYAAGPTAGTLQVTLPCGVRSAEAREAALAHPRRAFLFAHARERRAIAPGALAVLLLGGEGRRSIAPRTFALLLLAERRAVLGTEAERSLALFLLRTERRPFTARPFALRPFTLGPFAFRLGPIQRRLQLADLVSYPFKLGFQPLDVFPVRLCLQRRGLSREQHHAGKAGHHEPHHMIPFGESPASLRRTVDTNQVTDNSARPLQILIRNV